MLVTFGMARAPRGCAKWREKRTAGTVYPDVRKPVPTHVRGLEQPAACMHLGDPCLLHYILVSSPTRERWWQLRWRARWAHY
jgi:hypothetical protein